MELLLQSTNEALLQTCQTELTALVEKAGLHDILRAGEITPQAPQETHKGDYATIFTVLVTAVGAGGALTVALSKEGFLTPLARLLEKYLTGGDMTVTIHKTPKTEHIELSGSARQIEKILTVLANERYPG
jgi:hypothetical protein